VITTPLWAAHLKENNYLKNKMDARIAPLNKLKDTSFIKRLNKEPLNVLLAKP
jgi:hypothetical protein